MFGKSAALALCLSACCWSSAWAHFIWIDANSAAGKTAQAVFFGERPEPGDAHLLPKITGTKAWVRGVDGEVKAAKLGAPVGTDTALLPVDGPELPASSVEAVCDYGVYSRGPSGVLLHYYAKHLQGDWSQYCDKLAHTSKLKLDIVPTVADGKLNLQVLYQDKPVAKSEVVVVDAKGEEQQLSTDADGRAATAVVPGKYAIRAAFVEPNNQGERDGKKYIQVWHYATLTLALAAPSASTEVSGLELLKRARDGRALWTEGFTGFTTDVEVMGPTGRATGKATIDADGNVTLDMPESPLQKWTEEQLISMVQHRRPEGEVSEGNVTYADNDAKHPLGRLIDLGDVSLGSKYRIKDDAIMEVNRSAGPTMRFTISVLDIVRNAENKYLPRAFTMNFFDTKSGDLRTSLGYWNDWVRVGKFDLPKSIVEINAHKGGADTRQIAFSNHKLLEAK